MANEGESMSAQVRVVGEIPGVFLEGNQEGIRKWDFEGVGGEGGGRQSHVGKRSVAGTTYGSIVANLTLRGGA